MSAQDRCTCGETACESELCDCDARPCPVDHAAEEQRSAAEAIHERIHGPGHCEPPCGLCREVSGLLEDYAHELAEKQRKLAAPAAMLRSERMQGFAEGARAAADLIDPEVLNSGG